MDRPDTFVNYLTTESGTALHVQVYLTFPDEMPTDGFTLYLPDVRDLADAIDGISKQLFSPNELDRNLESANVVDGLFAIARAISKLAPE